MDPHSRMFQCLIGLRDEGFAPTGILDIGAFDGDFSRGVRQIFPDTYILMIDALAEKELVLADVCHKLGNADYLIAMLGKSEMPTAPFFVVDTKQAPNLIKSGSSKFKENANFPFEERALRQRTLASIVTDRAKTFQMLKLDVQGAEIDVLRGFGHHLSDVDAILMEMSLVDYNNGAPLIDAVLHEVRQMGFVLGDVVEEHRDRGGHLLQIDGLFLRPNSRFRAQPPFWS